MREMSNQRNRATSVSSALSSLHKVPSLRRAQTSITGLTPRSIRVVVLGVGGVGKTAMCVRFSTKRYIGDYDPSLETIYRHTAVVDEQLVNFEIMDTAGQENHCLQIEDKCKWGESFIFVYDVTDKYSFNELTRLKFIAGYTHSRMRVNFKPCWMLVGNKRDLAEHERMVSIEEGMALARELGCHMFREISVKESINDASEVFEDLWREFSRLSPRSPSTSQRRKFSVRIQDKISVLDSEACTCASEALKTISHRHNHNHMNEKLVTTLTSTLKRQSSAPLISLPSSRQLKHSLLNHSNGEDPFDYNPRSIPSIPENIKEEPEEVDSDPHPTGVNSYQRFRRNAILSDSSDVKNPPRKILSSDNISFKSFDSVSSPGRVSVNSVSSYSSSNTSLNSISESVPYDPKSSVGRNRSSSDASIARRKNSEESNHLTSLYQQHCFKHRARKWELKKCNQQFSHLLNNNNTITGPFEVRGF